MKNKLTINKIIIGNPLMSGLYQIILGDWKELTKLCCERYSLINV